ncbi:hypothetical protein [Bacillus toyonensis]|uniref:hypothetical protein n=1 Tax=Bacillus toyonensis TaxID=155322 RepID=UPI000BF9C8A5|nr:hypothetical protein [Bacillus toyonensis]PGF04995.1 hypothetical protein COM61_00730 [Bacillus toyonensis]
MITEQHKQDGLNHQYSLGQLVLVMVYAEELQSHMVMVGTLQSRIGSRMVVHEISSNKVIKTHADYVVPLYSDTVYLVENKVVGEMNIAFHSTIRCAIAMALLSEELEVEEEEVEQIKARDYLIELSKENGSTDEKVDLDNITVHMGAEFIAKFVVPYKDLSQFQNKQQEEVTDDETVVEDNTVKLLH